MAEHLVFYDGKCGLCDRAVQFILKRDNQEKFIFAPIQGETALTMLRNIPETIKDEDSLILIENYQTGHPKVFILGKGILRICWLLGGLWGVVGFFSLLPSWCVDWAYRIIARNRHKLLSKDPCKLPTPQARHRFLP